MEKYTVLLVDDEEEVIQVIMKKINWEGLGFSVIGYATNGANALEMVEDFQPDVVMTDIKMPYMDGMELAHHIKADYPITKILLLSGFDEFEYAKEAIHLEVEEYILKPVNSIELTEVFTQLKTKLDQEISEKRNIQVLQKNYMDSLPFLQTNFYASLMEGRIPREDIPKYLTDYQISFQGPYYCCIVVHTSFRQIGENMTAPLLLTFVQKQAQERLGEKWQAKCFSYLGNTILIAQLNHENDVSELTDECDRFCGYAHRIVGAVVVVGIGSVCEDILNLPQSYADAREAVSYRAIYGTSRAINMKEIAPREMNQREETHEVELANLFKMIRVNTEEAITGAVDSYLAHISFPDKSLQQHHIDIMELVSELYRFTINNDITVGDFLGDVRTLYGGLLDLEPEALRRWLLDISLSFHEELLSARNRSTKSFVARAKEYVRNNYANEELSLNSICDVLGVSNSYFSTVFKKETGDSFIGYVTDYRMEQASRQLIETNEKSHVIAKNVGYTDPNYFSYVFKRRYGVSPSKYRTEYAESEK